MAGFRIQSANRDTTGPDIRPRKHSLDARMLPICNFIGTPEPRASLAYLAEHTLNKREFMGSNPIGGSFVFENDVFFAR